MRVGFGATEYYVDKISMQSLFAEILFVVKQSIFIMSAQHSSAFNTDLEGAGNTMFTAS